MVINGLTLFPEETPYSYVVRLWLTSAYPSTRKFLTELIGNAHYQLHTAFPSYIPQIARLTEESADVLLLEHSLFPYFSAFLTTNRREELRAKMLHGNTGALQSQLSLLANRIPQTPTLKYCPLCANNDLDQFGVAYWHVNHQLPFTQTCPLHGCRLLSILYKRRDLILPPQSQNELSIGDVSSDKERLFTSLSDELLSHNGARFDQARLAKCYRHGLRQSGFCTDKESVHQFNWAMAVKAFWRADLPPELFTALYVKRSHLNFPRCLLYQPNAAHHPIKHILIIGQLLTSFDDFKICYEAGHGLEDMPPALKKPMIPRVSAQSDGILDAELGAGKSLREAAKRASVSIGYAKSFALKHNYTIERRAQKIFGEERKQILEMLKKGAQTKVTAKSVGCSVGAVEQVLTQTQGLSVRREQERRKMKRKLHQKTIQMFLKERPQATRNDIKRMCGAAYSWFFKNDKNSLNDLLPPAIPRKERYSAKKNNSHETHACNTKNN